VLLEGRGVRKEAFINLQEAAKADIFLAGDSLDEFRRLIKSHNFGGNFHLAFILEELYALGLDFKSNSDKTAIESAFLGRLLLYAMNHSLREVKFRARIPVPNSYQLVGVADEGQAYIAEGANPENVFTLQQGQIYGTIYLRASCHFVHKVPHSLRARVCGQRSYLSQGHMRYFQESSDPPW